MVKPYEGSSYDKAAQVVMDLCISVDTPRSLAVYLCIKYDAHDELINFNADPTHYDSAYAFKLDRLVSEVMKKCPDLDLKIDRAQAALDKFYEGEALCASTNKYIGTLCDSRLIDIQEEVAKILGPCSKRVVNHITTLMGHGPGATFCLKGNGSLASDKFRQKTPSLTYNLIPFARSLMGLPWANSVTSFNVVPGNKFTTVPKDAKTDRGICIEPLLNVYVQKGIGAYFRRRLSSFGCNLNDQTINQWLASRAQSDGLSTIDLSLASDSLSIGLVARVLPPRWLHLLELVRSESTVLPDGSVVALEKFSSMGNGFTFELESLIFYAILRVACRHDKNAVISTYGDDLICPQKYAGRVIDLLELCGFRVNRSKSFLAGRFFESCGSDYFDGRPVRPFYYRGRTNMPVEIQLANRLRLFCKGSLGCDPIFKWIWSRLVAAKRLRGLLVPEDYGDVGFITDLSEVSNLKRGPYEDSFYSKSLAVRPVKRRKRDIFVLWAAGRSDFSKGREPVRGWLRRHKVVKKPLRFTDGLAWLF